MSRGYLEPILTRLLAQRGRLNRESLTLAAILQYGFASLTRTRTFSSPRVGYIVPFSVSRCRLSVSEARTAYVGLMKWTEERKYLVLRRDIRAFLGGGYSHGKAEVRCVVESEAISRLGRHMSDERISFKARSRLGDISP